MWKYNIFFLLCQIGWWWPEIDIMVWKCAYFETLMGVWASPPFLLVCEVNQLKLTQPISSLFFLPLWSLFFLIYATRTHLHNTCAFDSLFSTLNCWRAAEEEEVILAIGKHIRLCTHVSPPFRAAAVLCVKHILCCLQTSIPMGSTCTTDCTTFLYGLSPYKGCCVQ